MRGYIPSQAELKHFLTYSPETGLFSWNYREHFFFSSAQFANTWNTNNAGQMAGCKTPTGYIQIRIHGHSYLAHRLALLYQTGSYPSDEIDHINHNRADNSWGNLRVASRAENQKNQSLFTTNKSGCAGIYWNKESEKWHAQLTANGRRIHIGLYDSLESAIEARKKAETENGFHANHGRKSCAIAGF